MTSFNTLLHHRALQVERFLDELLYKDVQQGELARPPRLLEAMRYAVLGGGKRLRAFLVLQTAHMMGIDDAQAMPAAAALELLHAYSLVHDDLPCMDDDDLRRGKPSLHRAFDEATAILAGDGLQCLAFEVLAKPCGLDLSVQLKLVHSLAQASGLGGMVGGQMLDLAAEGRFASSPTLRDERQVRLLQEMKTGALLRFSVEAGALLGRASSPEYEALIRYGTALGAAFQIADDLLDIEASPYMLGKASGKDAAKGKITLIDCLGLEVAKAHLHDLVNQAVEALSIFGAKADVLREAALFTALRKT
jgi:farnesyl diphosphate synthase